MKSVQHLHQLILVSKKIIMFLELFFHSNELTLFLLFYCRRLIIIY